MRNHDDHPATGPHAKCLTDHSGRGVPEHCRRGCRWPCPDASVDPRSDRNRDSDGGATQDRLVTLICPACATVGSLLSVGPDEDQWLVCGECGVEGEGPR